MFDEEEHMKLKKEDVEWVVNNMAELGVKIGDQFFFLYKGNSYQGGEKWRYVGKREFGECCYPWSSIEKEIYGDIKTARPIQLPETYVGFYKEESNPDFDNPWQDLPKSFESGDCAYERSLQMSEFKPGDVVRFKGGKDEWTVKNGDPRYNLISLIWPHDGIEWTADPDRLELVRRPGPVVFECTWMSDGHGLPFYPCPGPSGGFPDLKQFSKKKTEVTIKEIE